MRTDEDEGGREERPESPTDGPTERTPPHGVGGALRAETGEVSGVHHPSPPLLFLFLLKALRFGAREAKCTSYFWCSRYLGLLYYAL